MANWERLLTPLVAGLAVGRWAGSSTGDHPQLSPFSWRLGRSQRLAPCASQQTADSSSAPVLTGLGLRCFDSHGTLEKQPRRESGVPALATSADAADGLGGPQAGPSPSTSLTPVTSASAFRCSLCFQACCPFPDAELRCPSLWSLTPARSPHGCSPCHGSPCAHPHPTPGSTSGGSLGHGVTPDGFCTACVSFSRLVTLSSLSPSSGDQGLLDVLSPHPRACSISQSRHGAGCCSLSLRAQFGLGHAALGPSLEC